MQEKTENGKGSIMCHSLSLAGFLSEAVAKSLNSRLRQAPGKGLPDGD
jgi:hypothetical protein